MRKRFLRPVWPRGKAILLAAEEEEQKTQGKPLWSRWVKCQAGWADNRVPAGWGCNWLWWGVWRAVLPCPPKKSSPLECCDWLVLMWELTPLDCLFSYKCSLLQCFDWLVLMSVLTSIGWLLCLHMLGYVWPVLLFLHLYNLYFILLDSWCLHWRIACSSAMEWAGNTRTTSNSTTVSKRVLKVCMREFYLWHTEQAIHVVWAAHMRPTSHCITSWQAGDNLWLKRPLWSFLL